MDAVRDRHHGKAAIVIGGGPSSPSDFEAAIKAYPDAVHFSANNHGSLLPNARPKYWVHVDETHSKTRERMDEFLRRYGATCIVGRFQFDDLILLAIGKWHVDSGLATCLLAQAMGCAPVIPCGFDRWTAPEGAQYFHTRDTGEQTRESVRNRDPYHFGLFGGLSVLRAVSGPLLEHFPALGVQAAPDSGAVDLTDPAAYYSRARIPG